MKKTFQKHFLNTLNKIITSADTKMLPLKLTQCYKKLHTQLRFLLEIESIEVFHEIKVIQLYSKFS